MMINIFSKLLPLVMAIYQPAFSNLPGNVSIQDTTGPSSAFPAIDRLFKAFAAKNHCPGLVYGIIIDGKLAFTGNAGYSNLGKKYPATIGTAFRIASMTKSFVSVAILQLRDAGKLRLDDPAERYISALKGLQYASGDAPPLTIRNLLTHSAGFPEDNPWGDRQLAATNEELLTLIRNGISFSNSPGIGYEYSNLGFTLLGYIIQQVSGQSYEDYITQHILQPLGMNHTYWEYSKVPENQLAHGYRWINGDWTEQPMLHDGAYGAMGGMITTIEDFAQYTAFQLNAWPPRSDKETGPLKRSSIREMQQPWVFNNLNIRYAYPGGAACPLVSSYGYGLRWAKDCKGRTFVMHSGGLPGFGSNWTILPDYGVGVICFSNLTYAATGAIDMQVLDTLIALGGLKPRKVPVSPILEQRKKELTALLPGWQIMQDGERIAGEQVFAARQIFADNFFQDYFLSSLREEATAIFKQAGKIIRVGDMVAENGMRGSFIMEGEKENIELKFTLTPENPARIQEYHIQLVAKNNP